jgi:hypothetical protein
MNKSENTKKNSVVRIVLICGICLIVGCATNNQEDQFAKFRTIKIEPINIAIGTRFAALKDHSKYIKDDGLFPTGRTASEIFIGDSTSLWKIELLSSQLNVNYSEGFLLPTCDVTAIYNISCLLTGPETKIPLTSSRTGSSKGSFNKAITQAIYESLKDISEQVKILIPPTKSETNAKK